jgi:predicted acylesterase/phospholipase RssA/CRP-like cAMP-binding protein
MSSEELERLVTEVAALPRWGGFSGDFLRAILADYTTHTFGPGDRLSAESAEEPSMFLIVEGSISQGGDQPASPGDLLGEGSLTEGREWKAALKADAPVRALGVRLRDLRQVWWDFGEEMKSLPELALVCSQQSRLCEALRTGALGSYLDEPSIRGLAGTMTFRNVMGGTKIFLAGEPSDSLLVVISGRLGVSEREAGGSVRLIAELGYGSSVGELGLILNQKRQADVSSLRDSTVATLDRGQYERLLTAHPVPIAGAFFRMIYQHLREDGAVRRSTKGTIAVVPLGSQEVATRTTLGLKTALSKLGVVTHISPADAQAWQELHQNDDSLIGHLDDLERRSDFLLYEATDRPDTWTMRAGRQADQVMFVADADGPTAETAVEQTFGGFEDLSFQRRSLLLEGGANSGDPNLLERWRVNRESLPLHHISGAGEEDYDRLARRLTDRRIGLVLGGGGARGFAHLGVLRALEESEIPVDWVGGNSVGALIGAQHAMGIPFDTILKDTIRFVSAGEWPTLPIVSVLGGQRFLRGLQRIFGDVTIESLPVPFYCVSSNLSEACLKIHETGPLWHAIAASNSPPGLLPPIPDHGSLLVDGAVLDNVPADVMRERIGGSGTLIAVDVNLREEMKVPTDVTQLSAWSALRSRFGRKEERPLPGIAEILTRAGILGGLAQQQKMRSMVDHYLQPPVSQFNLMAYSRAKEIAECGYQYTLREIESWKFQA